MRSSADEAAATEVADPRRLLPPDDLRTADADLTGGESASPFLRRRALCRCSRARQLLRQDPVPLSESEIKDRCSAAAAHFSTNQIRMWARI